MQSKLPLVRTNRNEKITIFVCAFAVFGTHAAPAHSFGPPNLGNLHCNGNSDLIVIRGGKFTE